MLYGGVDSTDFSSMDPEKGLKTMLLSYRPPSGSSTTAVPATTALHTTTAPSTTKTSESAAYTPAPTKPVSSAITTGAALAFVALALAASMA
ncbi:hypothetical protein SDRG_06281 [Saprolegnia diclina VS20]|uniref:Uncharacterized protein n=1 Tax=Saprolegnia diclina (strain VS20) TaxID=1156394 RepID=T0RUM8_SAPDV|nr:hypothetical protein SDRG_06281 [Saprolegnia diclina VS20]EQC36168.1 hypothetical protein SDRG_06281 [Saprolegnia diclina VS20]|eukprot:XP_008610274.1 hypothetical protein SDRG_06281 [Saprolegnia diclina VS20]